MSRPYADSPQQLTGMPPGIPYIIGNEAAERFSFYGMRTILTVFMVNYLWLMGDAAGTRMGDTEATRRFHDFVTLVYLTPLFGALLADFLFGKYRIIMWLSVVYCLGHAALAVMGMAGEATFWLGAGLWLISIGSGGIKPCVSAHVGDQFGRSNRHLLPRIFNWFYWSINLGAFASTLLTPWLLEWHGPHWAFGVPGILMALATLVFWLGRWKFVHIPARGWHVLREMFSLEGLKAVGKLCAIYAFVAVFWALFDQSGSSWVLQAENMDLRWLGIEWLPSQIQALNPILILTFIPLFSYVVYPFIDRFYPLTALRKIAIGLFIMVISFVLVAVAQTKIDAGETPSISWQIVAYVALTAAEVMVSIVSLEFSYTQAPKSMKSLIMSLWLFAVALGNQVTARINDFIQVGNPVAAISATETSGNEIAHGGHDGQAGTDDDLVVVFDEAGKRADLRFNGREDLDALLANVEAAVVSAEYRAPSGPEGIALLAGATDPWGNPYHYRTLNRNLFRVWSYGPDKTPYTEWDQGALLSISRPAVEDNSAIARFFAKLRPARSWLDRRREELGLPTEADTAATGPTISREYFVGGLVKLEGAAYFWFFSGLMLAAAVLFLIVAKLYRPREYFHDEEEEAEATEEAAGR
ncbi:MAG: MFS transporter [Verrucomicrobiae bacterium]|nr:MFS transporter [Verrucomicrobiae bacterium]